MTTSTRNPLDDLPILYHGTTAKSWRTTHTESSTLYVTLTLSDAELYAQETFESEYEENPRGKAKVFAIQPDRLKRLLSSEGVTLEPDWGWVEAQQHEAKRNGGTFTEADATWEKSLKACGSIAISGFIDAHKPLFKALTEEVALDANPSL
jgi:hypothetical protein